MLRGSAPVVSMGASPSPHPGARQSVAGCAPDFATALHIALWSGRSRSWHSSEQYLTTMQPAHVRSFVAAGRQVPGVVPVAAEDGWPDDEPDAGADGVDGAGTAPQLQQQLAAGRPLRELSHSDAFLAARTSVSRSTHGRCRAGLHRILRALRQIASRLPVETDPVVSAHMSSHSS